MKYINQARKYGAKVAILSAAGTASAFAVGPDFTTLTAAVDFTTVGTAVMAIAALLAVVLVIKKGARMVLSAIK